MNRAAMVLLISAIVIFIGLIAGVHFQGNAGYVLIMAGNLKIELTIVSALVLLTIAAFMFWFVMKVFAVFFALGHFSFRWFGDWGQNRKKRLYEQGLLAWFANEHDKAEALFKRLDGVENEGMEFLFLAKIAESKGEQEQQQQWLSKAQKFKKTRAAAELNMARLATESGDTNNALALLESAEFSANDQGMLEVKAAALAKSGQWRQLMDALNGWKKGLGKTKFQQWRSKAAIGIYAEIASKEGANSLLTYWQKEPRSIRKDVTFQAAFITQLIEQGFYQEAEEYLVSLQPKAPEPMLLPLFARLSLHQPIKTIKKLEGWLKQDENNADLLSILGMVAYNAEDFILAEKVLQKSLKLRNSQADLTLLAKVKESKQDNDAALQLYKKAMDNR